MRIEDLRRAAVEKARGLPEPLTDTRELVRVAAREFFARVPEPPVYRRRDDPARARATSLLAEGEDLLAAAYTLGSRGDAELWRAAIDAHLEALCLLSEGRVEIAEDSWQQALALERRATADRRLWSRSDEARPRVYDRASGASRFDPHPETAVQAKLACPSCRKVSELAFSPAHARHEVRCRHCASTFWAYLAEARSVEVTRSGPRCRYVFRLEELAGPQTRLELEDANPEELRVAPRELLAFLYQPATVLRGVLNLDSGRVLWLSGNGPCFVATVTLGEGAGELAVLRAYRDRVLRRHAAGRGFIAWYYRHGPALARTVVARPWLRSLVRRGLTCVVAELSRRPW